MKPSIWIFGYGSILWRPDFRFSQAIPAQLQGFHRRLCQGSTDHRGSSAFPGAVATLRPDPRESTTGIAYQLEGAVMERTLIGLNHREKNGYEQQIVSLVSENQRVFTALTYIAPVGNPWDLGTPSTLDIAERVLRASGPSGSNLDYFLRLYASNLALNAPETYLDRIYGFIKPGLSPKQQAEFDALHSDPTLLPCQPLRRPAL